jgi:hypothetical protein
MRHVAVPRAGGLVLCCAVVAAVPANVDAAVTPKGALTRLVKDTRTLSARVVVKKKRSALLASALAARRAVRSKPCRSVQQLKTFQRLLPRRRATKRVAGAVGTLRADASTASALLLASGRAAKCGGAKTAATATTATSKLLQSDNTGVTMQVDLPPAQFVGRIGAGRGFTQMFMPGMSGGGAGNGTPELPSMATDFAVPNGAATSVKVEGSSIYTVSDVSLWPSQDPSADKAGPPFLDPPFQLNRGAYASNAAFPPGPAQDGGGGQMRDIATDSLRVFGGQFQARSGKLKVFTQLTVRMNFDGGSGQFGDQRTLTGWEDGPQSFYAAALANWKDILGNIRPPKRFPFCGEQLLIVTPTALRPAADTLANARRADGFLTRVVETGGAGNQAGTTTQQIQTFIRGELNSSCLIRPSYIVLMGDTAQLPTFTPPTTWGPTDFDGNIASDLPYSEANDADNIADAALGRIPAPDLATAQTVVNKIVSYEDSPPASFDFYHHGLNASYFQGSDSTDDRTFLRTSEAVRTQLMSLGNSVDRVYDDDSATVDPQFFDDGTPIPNNLRKPAFAWNGSCCTQNITDAWNAGRFYVFHRDHGYPGGWGDPPYSTGNVASLTNGAFLPVVFSINCASGKFDDPGSPSFAEQILQKSGGGAVGVIGDSRNSPSGTNSNMALGMFDAIFPNLLPSFGSSTSIRRMGDVLNVGKAYVDNQESPANGWVQAEHLLYHWFGDPTMQIWGGTPPRLIHPELVSAVFEKFVPPGPPDPGDPPYRIRLNINDPELIGGVATVLRNGAPVGRAVINGSALVIDSDSPAGPSDLSVEIDQSGFVAGRVPVNGQPAPASPPPPAPAQASMTQTCPATPQPSGQAFTVTGTLTPAHAGAAVRVTYTKPDSTTVTHNVTTDAQGGWTDSITPAFSEFGSWTVRSHHDADANTTAADAGPCTVTVFNNG